MSRYAKYRLAIALAFLALAVVRQADRARGYYAPAAGWSVPFEYGGGAL